MEQQGYSLLLCYDQDCMLVDYGLTDLFYKVDNQSLYILRIDHQAKSENEITIPIQNKDASIRIVLEEFLVNLMSYRKNFLGTPLFDKSDVFTKKEFDAMLKKGIELMDERDELAKLSNADNELIIYCKSIQLYPEPVGSSPTNWKANCLGGNHHIMISTKSNEWGCGYCGKKGDLNELKKWYERKYNIT